MDILGNNPNETILDGTFTNSTLNGSTTVVAQDGSTYNLQTPNNGNNLDVLTTDGVGNTYWASSGGTPTLQQVYDASGTPTAQVNISYGNKIRFIDDDSNDILAINSVVGSNSNISCDRANILTINSDAFIKNGGSDIQYLMADGSVLTSSANSGNSNFYLYDNTNSAVDTTPVAGEVIINNASNPLATIVYISHITRDTIDVEVFWQFVNQLTDLYIQDQNLSTNYVRYNITGVPTITTGDKIAIPVAYLTSDGTGDTSFGAGHNIMVSYFTNTLETDTRLSALETKTTLQTYNVGTGTTWTGVANFDNLNSPIMDSATTLAFGTNNQTALTIGRAASATNLRGSSIITTGNITPTTTNTGTIGTSSLLYNNGFFNVFQVNSITSAVAGSLTVGLTIQTGLTLGRVGANSLLNGLNVNLGQVPYINGGITNPIPANPRLIMAKYIMPVNNTVLTGTTILNTVAGGMGGLSTSASEQLVGTTWRYRFNGIVINAASTNTLSFQLVHAGGTQNISTWTYGVSVSANANFHGEIIMFYTAIGAAVSPQVSGHITFISAGTTVSLQNVSVSLFSPTTYNTTVANTNNIQIVANPSTGFQYTVNNFTCEWLR